jgi:trimeric autotransporter adhesin
MAHAEIGNQDDNIIREPRLNLDPNDPNDQIILRHNQLRSPDENNRIYGMGGNDTLHGWRGDDYLFGDRVPGDPGDPGVDSTLGDKQFSRDYLESLRGVPGNDYLDGGEGNDYLDGNQGDDTMLGGSGDDTYIVDSFGDLITEEENEGIDTVRSSISYRLGNNLENLVLIDVLSQFPLIADGNELNNKIIGNFRGNQLWGHDGNDTLDGGGSGFFDNDYLYGGAGNDTYIVNSVNNIITEYFDEGTDTVESSISYTLGDNLENLTLTGSSNINGTGNELNNTITGNSANNILDGGDGNDSLNGGDGNDDLYGGEGDDTLNGQADGNILSGEPGNRLYGGAGNDTYILNTDLYYNFYDVITEYANEGTDTVQSDFSYTLGDNLENLTLTGSALIGTGNELNNTITGHGGTNFLFGETGDDTLYGSGGFDVLNGGTGNDSLDGGDDDDDLYGESGDDTLDGGTGNNRLYGGTGNDTYIVRSTAEYIAEYSGEGTDTVESSVNYTLGYQLENLILTGSSSINGTGNELDNTITGNSANNILDGGGGSDSLSGGEGNDVLYGGEDIDNLHGDVGDDSLYGGAYDDYLNGDDGNDYIDGGSENDSLWGGNDNDTLVGGFGNDRLFGEDGSDRLNGYGTSVTNDSQFDTLVGGAGTDYFILGGDWGVSYVEDGPGYAIIADWDASSDYIEVRGCSNQYRLDYSQNWTGTSAIDTGIYYIGGGGDELIGVVQDTTNVYLSRNFIFV